MDSSADAAARDLWRRLHGSDAGSRLSDDGSGSDDDARDPHSGSDSDGDGGGDGGGEGGGASYAYARSPPRLSVLGSLRSYVAPPAASAATDAHVAASSDGTGSEMDAGGGTGTGGAGGAGGSGSGSPLKSALRKSTNEPSPTRDMRRAIFGETGESFTLGSLEMNDHYNGEGDLDRAGDFEDEDEDEGRRRELFYSAEGPRQRAASAAAAGESHAAAAAPAAALAAALAAAAHAVAPVVRTDVSPAGLNDTLGSVQFADTFGNKSALSEIRYMSDGSQSGGSSASSHGRSAASTALSEYERRLAVQQGQV